MNNFSLISYILILSTIGYAATDIYLPSLPAITESFATTNTYVQLTLTVYLLSFSITPLVFGPLSDMIGRKKIITYGMLTGTLATLACCIAPSIDLLLFSRFVQGIGFGMLNVTARAMIPDRFQGVQMTKYISIVGFLVPIIMGLAPFIGGHIQELLDWRYTFIFLLIYSSITLFMVTFNLEETNVKPQEKNWRNILKVYLECLKIKPFVLYGLIPSFAFMGITSYLSTSPYLFQDRLGLSPSEYGLVSLVTAAAVILCGLINTMFVERFSSRAFLYLSAVFMLTGSGVFLYTFLFDTLNTSLALLACIFFFMSLNFAMPNAFALAYKCLSGSFGSAGALIISTQVMIGMVTSSITAWLPEGNAISMMFFFGISGIGVLTILWFTRPN